jgi:REP element-mobilizing transposase RayT
MTIFHHQNIRLRSANYVGQRWHFVTICCEQRHPVFSSDDRAAWLIGILERAAVSAGFGIHAYCVMPDHLHVLGERSGCVERPAGVHQAPETNHRV